MIRQQTLPGMIPISACDSLSLSPSPQVRGGSSTFCWEGIPRYPFLFLLVCSLYEARAVAMDVPPSP